MVTVCSCHGIITMSLSANFLRASYKNDPGNSPTCKPWSVYLLRSPSTSHCESFWCHPEMRERVSLWGKMRLRSDWIIIRGITVQSQRHWSGLYIHWESCDTSILATHYNMNCFKYIHKFVAFLGAIVYYTTK